MPLKLNWKLKKKVSVIFASVCKLAFEICRHIRFSFACFGAKCYGTVRLRTRVNRIQNWHENRPNPCEQSNFPFQKSDQLEGLLSFQMFANLQWRLKNLAALQYIAITVHTRRFLGMTKMSLLPIRKLPEVSWIGQVSWCFMALGGIWKAFQVVFWCKFVCWDVFSDTWWKVWYLTEQYLNK